MAIPSVLVPALVLVTASAAGAAIAWPAGPPGAAAIRVGPPPAAAASPYPHLDQRDAPPDGQGRGPGSRTTGAGNSAAELSASSGAGSTDVSDSLRPLALDPPGGTGASSSGNAAASPGGRGTVGGLTWPLRPDPAVLRGFLIGPHRWSPGHRGVDLAAHPGQAVLAAAQGTVTFAGVLAGRGVVVVLHPDGVRTTYEPVTPKVTRGQSVAAGQVIGTIEAPAGHCQSSGCLHWGALRGDVYLDPLTLLAGRRGPPVLLPLLSG